MKVRVSNPSLVPSLLDFFERLGCGAVPQGVNVVDVELPATIDADQERMVLDVYLGVWRALHPDTRALTVD
jgi:hypothetical protein